VIEHESKLQRRVAGYHDIRMDGMTDLVCRAKGASVLDIGCNRGLVGFEFANNGAALVHGCDFYEDGLEVARHLFKDLRNCESKFINIDLTGGIEPFKEAFGHKPYDIILLLATYHKIKREMSHEALSGLMKHLGKRTTKYFAWRGTSEKEAENLDEMARLDKDLLEGGLVRVHTSTISEYLGLCAIWRK
jgi:ribosomal protein L11 methylase PrmA